MQQAQENANTELISTFHLGDTLFGIDTMTVQEVVRVGDITPVHHAPKDILGVINLRGKIVTIINLSERLGMKSAPFGEDTRIFIVDWEGEYIGLLVDRVADVLSVESEELDETPANVTSAQGKFIRGVYQFDQLLVTMLRPEAILSDEDGTERARPIRERESD